MKLAVRNHLKEILEKQGISQLELARRSGVAKRVVNEMTNQRHNYTIETARKLAETLGIKIEDLITSEYVETLPE